MIGAKAVKQLVYSLGADLCGIAPVERFANAPEGFRPEDLFPECRALIVFAKQVPAGLLATTSSMLYAHALDVLTVEVDRLGIELCVCLEESGVRGVPVPAEATYHGNTPKHAQGWGILSLRHAGALAGLGVLGKHSLLINRDYGSLIHLGTVLVDTELEPDPLAGYTVCRPHCRACLDACPQQALEGAALHPERCREISRLTSQGHPLVRCTDCQQACPHHLGL